MLKILVGLMFGVPIGMIIMALLTMASLEDIRAEVDFYKAEVNKHGEDCKRLQKECEDSINKCNDFLKTLD